MDALTTKEAAIACLMVAVFLGILLYLNWRAGRVRPFRAFNLHGPAVPAEFNRVFGAYATSKVEGLIVLQDGIRVGYEDGTSVQFIPVPHEGVLCVDEQGNFVVKVPGDDIS